MRKNVKKIGSILGVYFTKEDCKIYGIKLGDIIDLEFVILPKNKIKGGTKYEN